MAVSRGLLRSTVTAGSMTLLSRCSGLARDMTCFFVFGAGPALDAFLVAFRIPNFLRRVFAEGAFSQAFVPVLSEYQDHRDRAAVRALLDHSAALLGSVLLLLCVLGVLAAPWLVWVFAPGFARDPEQLALAGAMLRLTFPYLLCISLCALCAGILHSRGRFAAPAFAPVLLNLALIAGALWLAPRLAPGREITALVWAVLLVGPVQLLFLSLPVARLGLLPRPRLGADAQGVRRILRLMLPATLGVSVAQVNTLVDMVIASFLTAGSISWLYCADRLVEFPLGVCGIAVSTVILPRLAMDSARNAGADYRRHLDWGLRMQTVIGVPAAVGLSLCAEPIIITLFQYFNFQERDAHMAAGALYAYALGLPALMWSKVLAAACFSRQDTVTPVRAAVSALICNIVFSLLLVIPLQHIGLALASSLAALVNAALLYLGVCRRHGYRPVPGWPRFLALVGGACLLLAAVLLAGPAPSASWLQWGFEERLGKLLLWVAVGSVLYFLVLRLGRVSMGRRDAA